MTLPMLLPLPANRVRRNYRGGRMLDELEGALAPTDGNRPEDWIASTVLARNPGLDGVENEGLATVTALNGKPVLLRALFSGHPEHYLGASHFASLGTELGFLVKLLDSSMRLHVQAHPTAAFARRFLNSRWGKLETYVILGARSGCQPYIRLGFQRPPSPAEWRRIILEQDIAAMDACFDRIPVAPDEVWVVPGGVPHAIGEGLLVLETMEPTDLVVRCEFEREGIVVPPAARFMGRNPDFALGIFDYTPLSESAVRARCCIAPTVLRREAGLLHERLIGSEQTDCFVIERVSVASSAAIAKTQTIQIGVVADGAGQVCVGDEAIGVRRGSRFLLAAAARELRVEASPDSVTILLCRPG
ncbi:MAG: class I mannose-6-phosphate isomerase [Phycisphaerae bacterium]|nr:class I mannose-6-phosphate isomerase [Phycisphaerae bacterium]